METDGSKRLSALRQRILDNFESADWGNVEFLRKQSDVLRYYPRLLLNLSRQNREYSNDVLEILKFIASNDPRTFNKIESYVAQHILGRRDIRRITVAPRIFEIPDLPIVPDLVAVMIPLRNEFARVFDVVELACDGTRFQCRRGDDIWEDSSVMQDVFNLVFRSGVVIVDFTSKNPNVLYEIGMAHTLGKHVVAISQSLDDVPFDLLRHRVLRYSADPEGLRVLQSRLEEKLRQIGPPAMEAPTAATGKIIPVRLRS